MPRRILPVVALVAVFGGFAGYRWAPWRESPREAWDAISSAAAAGDYGAVWDRFDPASRVRLSPWLREFAPDPALADRERFARLLTGRPDVRAQFLPARVLEAHEVGDRAAILLDRPDPLDRSPAPTPTAVVFLTRHAGRWRLSVGADAPE
jgi:hypothetical protein